MRLSEIYKYLSTLKDADFPLNSSALIDTRASLIACHGISVQDLLSDGWVLCNPNDVTSAKWNVVLGKQSLPDAFSELLNKSCRTYDDLRFMRPDKWKEICKLTCDELSSIWSFMSRTTGDPREYSELSAYEKETFKEQLLTVSVAGNGLIGLAPDEPALDESLPDLQAKYLPCDTELLQMSVDRAIPSIIHELLDASYFVENEPVYRLEKAEEK